MIVRINGNWETKKIRLNGEPLSPARSLEIANRSPDGFNWGYAGSGPSQLSLAILLEIYPKHKAIKLYQTFKFDCIAKLPKKNFDIEVYLPDDYPKTKLKFNGTNH